MILQEEREKVIKGLECCKIPFTKCYNGGCPYFENDGCKARLKGDALALIEKQAEQLKEWEKYTGFLWAHGFFRDKEDSEPVMPAEVSYISVEYDSETGKIKE